MKFFSKHRPIVTAMTVLVMGAVGLVYAAWTTNGSGSGYAKAGSASALTTVDVSATTAASLYPGVTGNVKIEISNPNPYPVTVTAVSGNGTITADATSVTAGCTNAAHGVTFTDQTGLSISVPAKSGGVNGSTTATLNNAAQMANSSVNACQGAMFTIPVSLTGASG